MLCYPLGYAVSRTAPYAGPVRNTPAGPCALLAPACDCAAISQPSQPVRSPAIDVPLLSVPSYSALRRLTLSAVRLSSYSDCRHSCAVANRARRALELPIKHTTAQPCLSSSATGRNRRHSSGPPVALCFVLRRQRICPSPCPYGPSRRVTELSAVQVAWCRIGGCRIGLAACSGWAGEKCSAARPTVSYQSACSARSMQRGLIPPHCM